MPHQSKIDPRDKSREEENAEIGKSTLIHCYGRKSRGFWYLGISTGGRLERSMRCSQGSERPSKNARWYDPLCRHLPTGRRWHLPSFIDPTPLQQSLRSIIRLRTT